jgi:kinesin family protein C2/C3
MYDLLSDPSGSDHCKLSLGRDRNGSVKVQGVLEVEVKSLKAAQHGLDHAFKHRNTKGTAINDRSNLSHCIVRMKVKSSNRFTGCRYKGCLHLVDLAGSEKLGFPSSFDRKAQERKHIQQTLSNLGGVFYALSSKQSHIPYQNSKLTFMLSDYLGMLLAQFLHVRVA